MLGGGVGLNADLVLTPVRLFLTGHGPAGLPPAIAVEVAALGDDAGLAGAASWRAATRHLA